VLAEDLAAKVRGEQVGFQDAVELFIRDVEEWRRSIHACAVDERIDAAIPPYHRFVQRLHRQAAVRVHLRERGLAAKFLNGRDALFASLRATAGDDHRRACLC
jgi:hypothetical protein